jgi:opacity protein-like surface antigen
MTLKSSILAVTSVLLLSTSVFANQKGLFKSGAYVGASFGYSRMHGKVNDSINIPFPVNIYYSASGSNSSNGIVGGIDLGYRHFFNNGFLLGIEAGIARDNNELTKDLRLNTTQTTRTKLKSSYIITPAVVFGKTLNNRWLAFAKLGVSLRKFTGTHNIKGTTRNIDDKFNTRKAGSLAAVGAEYAFSDKVSATGSVSYERFGSINRSLPSYSTAAGEKDEVNIKHPSYITAKVGIIYKF